MGTESTLITVLTPTFNRADTLPRLFDSLVGQTLMSFEWLIVDDGSTDGTASLIDDLRLRSPFDIGYARQENSGKHIALNHGMSLITTPLTAMWDSDDWYLPTGLETLERHWREIPDGVRERFANVEGRCRLADGTRLGTIGDAIVDSDYYEMTIQKRVWGDTCGLWRTDVLRAYPFPADLGRFVSEELVWNRIAARHRTRYIDEVVAVKDYRPGGLSDRLADTATLVDSSASRLLYLRELLDFGRPMPLSTRIRAHANETRHALHAGEGPIRQARVAPHRLGWLTTFPIGFVLYLRDRWRVRGSDD